MLRDRRVLIEQNIQTLQKEAASMYLSMAVSQSLDNTHITVYNNLREEISTLEFELSTVNHLIAHGHK
jgi:hypothetical protein